MKILFNNNVLSGLLSFREDVIKHFIDQGHEVVLVTPHTEDKQLLMRIPSKAKHLQIDMARDSMNPIHDIKYFFRLFKVLRKEKPDYVFNYTIKPNIYGSLACRLQRIPSTAMLAGLGYTFSHKGLAAKIGRSLYRFALRFPQHVLFLNRSNVEVAKSIHLCNPDKIIWLEGGEGVNLEKYGYHDNFSQEIRFLFIARLIKEKGYQEFVAAAREIKPQCPDVHFLVAGGLSLASPGHVTKQELDNDIQSGAIEYLGNVSDMPALYAQPGICVVIPSYYSEGLNRSLMEACSAGKPIITTRMPGCEETVIEGKNGYLVKPRDVQDLCIAMKSYIQLSNTQRNLMSSASRRLAEEKFDVKKVITVYDDIINGIK